MLRHQEGNGAGHVLELGIYFGREPRELTPAEMAFLVVIIPGPIKYQSSLRTARRGLGCVR